MKNIREMKEDFKIKYQQADIFRITSICLTILFLGLMSASVTHAETYSFVTKWGSEGTGNGQFIGPESIAVDPSGNVYVGEHNNRIQKFDSDGNYLNQWGSYGSGDGQFSYPAGIAIDSSDNVYVADLYNCRIEKFDSNGNFITKWGSEGTGNGQFDRPQGIAVDSLGNVYVADTNNNRVQKFNSDGNFITKWGSNGIGNGQFTVPEGIAVDSSGNVYVTDFGRSRIQKFDSKGNYLRQWGSYGSDNGQFEDPNDVAVDSSGNVYVADYWNYRIQKFDSKGNYITKWGSQGSADGQFNGDCGVAVDSSGNVYVADTYNDRIQKFVKTNSQIPPTAKFSSDVTQGYAPLKVTFTDKSTNDPTSWKWTYGDGGTSTVQHPTHTYSKAGKYTVSLTVKNSSGSNTTTKKNYINVIATVKPVAAFSASPTSGNAPLKVKFTDKSTGSPISWEWSFGDGKTSTSKSPVYTYSKAGKYTVSFTVKNAAGSSTKTIKNYIVVNELKAPVAAFSASPTSGNAPLKVQFTDKSVNNPTSWKWSFGDGTYSTSKGPAHKYSKAGEYTVSLTVKNAKGSNTKTTSNYITVKK